MEVSFIISQMNRLQACYSLLINRFAPFKKGDQVKLVQRPDATYFAQEKLEEYRDILSRLLEPGVTGTVMDVQAYGHGFEFGVDLNNNPNLCLWVYLSESYWELIPPAARLDASTK